MSNRSANLSSNRSLNNQCCLDVLFFISIRSSKNKINCSVSLLKYDIVKLKNKIDISKNDANLVLNRALHVSEKA